jgi:hypothetical protein
MIAVALITAINIWILYYLVQLEKSHCECALGNKHRFIKLYLSIMIPLTVLTIVFSIMRSSKLASMIQSHPTATYGIYMLLVLVQVVFIATVFLYIRELKATKCDCSQHHARTALEILNYIAIVMTVILLISFAILGNKGMKRIIVREMYSRFAQSK